MSNPNTIAPDRAEDIIIHLCPECNAGSYWYVNGEYKIGDVVVKCDISSRILHQITAKTIRGTRVSIYKNGKEILKDRDTNHLNRHDNHSRIIG